MCQSVVDTVFSPYEVVAIPVKILICTCWFPVNCSDEDVVRAGKTCMSKNCSEPCRLSSSIVNCM